MLKLGINGYGRIGRSIVRAIYERDLSDQVQLLAINDLAELDSAVYLTQYDSAHGRFAAEVTQAQDQLWINQQAIAYSREPDPSQLPWRELGVSWVFECSGSFADRAGAQLHLDAGAERVLISAPAGSQVDASVVYGVNHQQLGPQQQIVSNASCSTNCLAPIAQLLDQQLGIVSGMITSIHAYTNDQLLTDGEHPDMRRGRAAAMSMVPTRTGAGEALGLVLPSLAGKILGYSMRVPTLNVSCIDCTFQVANKISDDDLDQMIRQAIAGPLAGVVAYNEAPLVSIDFNHHPASAIYDATQTKVNGNLIKLLLWFDNEWAYANRMLDTALAWWQRCQQS